jgi:uncharacterized lipoprotein YddW (UPF0748 family)
MKLFISFLLALLILSQTACSQKPINIASSEPIRGTWITNVGSSILSSRDSIKAGVKLCKDNGLNHIFVVVWNQGKTLHPSAVTQQYIGVKQDGRYIGRDPLQEIIEEAHAQNIKVHAWFEFGFSYAYKDSNSIWVQKYPEWAGRNNKGALLQKNGFFWWSSIRPDVQQMLKELVGEVVANYNIDGIQGDDRMPAMPGEGGYDSFTVELYKKEHNGMNPPSSPFDSAWIQWKADKLSAFGKDLYHYVKRIKKDCMVSWAPSIYPWSKEQYLQDWPTWLKEGYADFIIPQMYRYNIKAYEQLLKDLQQQVPATLKHKIYPGMLTSLGDGYQSNKILTNQMIDLNRKYGFQGEVFFYFETLHRLAGGIYN